MLLYEVNVEINETIYEDYLLWLHSHVKEILLIDGFVRANIFEDQDQTDSIKKFSIQYFLKDQKSLESYLKNHAPRLRQDGIDRFGNQFKATRRVLELKESFN